MHFSQDTSWVSPKKATMQEMDPLQSGLTFNIQTSPISMLVQPTGSSLHTQLITTRKSESPIRSTNQSANQDNVRRANSELLANGPRKPLSILSWSISPTATQDTLQSNASLLGSNNDSRLLVTDSLPMSVMSNAPIPEVSGGLSIESTNVSQVTSSASDGLQKSNYTQRDVSGGPSSVRWSYLYSRLGIEHSRGTEISQISWKYNGRGCDFSIECRIPVTECCGTPSTACNEFFFQVSTEQSQTTLYWRG